MLPTLPDTFAFQNIRIMSFLGAFLIVYFIAMTFCGVPIFFQEVAIGQYLGSGGMTLVAQLCPMLKGVGIATMVLVFFLDIYYCIIIAWTFFYLFASFTALPDLPWNTCGTISDKFASTYHHVIAIINAFRGLVEH